MAAAALSMLAVPVSADAKRKRAAKPTLRMKAKFPKAGKMSFSVGAFKVTAQRSKRSRSARHSAKKRKRALKVKARIRNRARVPSNALVFLRVAKVKKKRNNFVASAIVVNSRKTSKSATTADDDDLQPGDEVEIEMELTLADGTVLRGKFIGTVVEDDDVEDNDPDNRNVCGPSGLLNSEDDGAAFSVRTLYNQILNRLSDQTLNRLFELTGDLNCDSVVDAADYAFYRSLLGIDGGAVPGAPPSPLCPGALQAAPLPFAATEFEIFFNCNQSASSLGFLVPGARSIPPGLFIPPVNLPNCQIQSAEGGTDNFLLCQGGTLPAGVQNIVRIHPSVQLGNCDKAKLYFNPLGTSSPAVTDTDAFATCP
ncbi:MAG: hypothetical protein WDZ37_04305 [Solirubrobacterales bacterium]